MAFALDEESWREKLEMDGGARWGKFLLRKQKPGALSEVIRRFRAAGMTTFHISSLPT